MKKENMSQPRRYNNAYIIGISFISALGGYLFGFDFAVIAGALPSLRNEFALTSWWEGFLTGSLALGCVVGCIIAGAQSERYGRKPGLLTAALLFAFSSIGMALAGSLVVFISMRFAAGIGVGMASMLSPLYIAEVSPAAVRGRNVAINQLTIVIGILITNLVNYMLAGTGPDAWRWMFGLGAVPAILFLVGVIWLPETPRWLMKAGRDTQARKVLQKIGDQSYVDESIASIKKTLQSQTTAVGSTGVFQKAVLPAVLVGVGLAVFQQFCGINVVFNFTTTIFESVGFSQDDQLKQTVFIGIVNLVFTLLAMWQVDKLGRKPLLLTGAAGLAILYIISAVLLQQKSPGAAWSLLAAIGTYAMSLAPVTWVLISEIFPNKVRGAATSVAVIALWLAYALLVFTFPVLAEYMGAYTPFYIYAGICVIGFFFIKIKVKETKVKTLEEIEQQLVRH
jgi:SP family xylose:H+ symportor-like MFS transporter